MARRPIRTRSTTGVSHRAPSGEHRGQRVRARFALATQPYLIELDDDVIEAPSADEHLLDASLRIPMMGYRSAALADDPKDSQAQYMQYLRTERNA